MNNQQAAHSKRFLVMAGGTGGHVFPALAAARRLQSLGHHVHWLGAENGMEVRLIGSTDIPLSLIGVTGLRGKGWWALLKAPLQLVRALAQALAVEKTVKPDCVLGMGGFASGPGGLAAWLLRTPLVIHEQNAVAGLTNRLLARIASVVLEAFPGSFGESGTRQGACKKGQVPRYTGNPVREDLLSLPDPEARLAAHAGPLRLLVIGGSLGALAINHLLPQALALMPLAQRPQVRHQCGERHLQTTQAAYQDAGVNVTLSAFIDNMAEAYGWADLVLCRAGALTVAELCAVGLGALLIPLPHAVDDHQTKNAAFMVAGHAALLLPEAKINAGILADYLKRLSNDPAAVKAMAIAARKLARTDATDRVVNYCLEAAHA